MNFAFSSRSAVRARGRAARHAIAIASTCCLTAGAAQAAPVFFEWSSISSGTAGGITATVASTIVSGEFDTNSISPTAPGFVAAYGSLIPVLDYGAPSTNVAGDVQSTIVFSQQLPTGAILMAFDMDWRGETFLLDTDLGHPALLGQGPTLAGETSQLPTYDVATGLLEETAPDADPNVDEYSLFDVSGASSLVANYFGGSLNSASRIAIAIPGGPSVPAIPVPAALPLAFGGFALLGALGWRRRP